VQLYRKKCYIKHVALTAVYLKIILFLIFANNINETNNILLKSMTYLFQILSLN